MGSTLDQKLSEAEWLIGDCPDGRTVEDTAAEEQMPVPTAIGASFTPMNGATDKACRGTYSADTGYQAAVPRFGAGKSYTMWTAKTLEDCKAYCQDNCKGIEYNAANMYCEVWHHPVKYTSDVPGYECYAATTEQSGEDVAFPIAEPSEEQMSCLSAWKGGCSSIENKLTCLSSKDGSDIDDILGLKVKGQACVWCQDGPCTSNSNSQCEPYDYLRNGEGKAFSIFHGRQEFSVAQCFNDASSLGAASPGEGDMSCLSAAASGCNTIFDDQQCLASKDGRDIESVAGLKVSGQPCVWCGGGFCSSNNANLCEPYQFAVYGAHHAFNTFYAKGTFKVAACNADGTTSSGVISVDGNGQVTVTEEGDAITTGETAANANAANTDAAHGEPTQVDTAAFTTAAATAAGESVATTSNQDPAAAGVIAAEASKAAGKTAEQEAAAAGEAAAAVAKAKGMSAAEQAAAAGPLLAMRVVIQHIHPPCRCVHHVPALRVVI